MPAERTHYHCCLADGVFSADGDVLRFHEVTAIGEAEVVALQEVVRKRMLALFERRGLLTPEAVPRRPGVYPHPQGLPSGRQTRNYVPEFPPEYTSIERAQRDVPATQPGAAEVAKHRGEAADGNMVLGRLFLDGSLRYDGVSRASLR